MVKYICVYQFTVFYNSSLQSCCMNRRLKRIVCIPVNVHSAKVNVLYLLAMQTLAGYQCINS